MGISLKGVTQIKTLACLKKSGGASEDRHVRHFQVASLELERARRLKERHVTVSRLQSTDVRLREIDELLRGHYAALGLSAGGDAGAAGTPPAKGEASRAHLGGVEDDTREEPRAPRRALVYGR